MSVTRTRSSRASRLAHATPAKPPPTITTCRPPVAESGMGRLPSRPSGAEALEKVVADPQRVGHGRQGRVHGADAGEEARVDDVEVVDLVRAAVGVEHRGGRIAPEAAGAGLV